MAADLAQAGDGLEDGEAALRQSVGAGGGEQHVLRLRELLAVEFLLQLAHFAEHVLLRAGRKFARDLALGAAHDEGAQPRGQPLPGTLVLAAVEMFLKIGAVAQGTGRGEAHQAPQVEQPVFQRRAGQHQAVLRVDQPRGLRHLGVGILDLLALVEDGGEPVDLLQGFDASAKLGVVDHQHVRMRSGRFEIERVFLPQHLHLQVWRRLGQFHSPHIEHRLRADDQTG